MIHIGYFWAYFPFSILAYGMLYTKRDMMKKIMIVLFCVLCGCSINAVPAKTLEHEIKLMIASDLHFQKELSSFSSSIIGQMEYNDEIVDALLDQAVNEQPEALILLGDLTNVGAYEDHKSMAEKLTELKAKGIDIYVVPGNHDLQQSTSAVFETVYADFGFNQAFSRDSDSLSYAAKLNDEFWLLALDTNEEKTAYGHLSNNSMRWIEKILKEAKQAQAYVLVFSHHNLLRHSMPGTEKSFMIDKADELSALLLRYGVPLYLSGHRHGRSVQSKERSGLQITEIVSDMLLSYPNMYGSLEFNTDASINYEGKVLDVSSWAEKQRLNDEQLLDFEAYSYALCVAKAENMGDVALSSKNLDLEMKEGMQAFLKHFYLAYVQGKIYQVRNELLADPAYGDWMRECKGETYQRWIEYVLNHYTEAYDQWEIRY